MSAVEVRPFRRGDREQITDIVNAHIAAVVPGAFDAWLRMLRDLRDEREEEEREHDHERH